MTVSRHTAPARRSSHHGSPYERRTRCGANCSAHSGSTPATTRPHSRDVSTSSAAITQRGRAFAVTEPGEIMNFDPCAPRYSRLVPSRVPRWLSRPLISAWCTWSGWASVANRPPFAERTPICPATWRSWLYRSIHSRTRR